jgi:hypothetical protein
MVNEALSNRGRAWTSKTANAGGLKIRLRAEP